jgi:AbrB family looped-hinge helix DNA binding protein
LNVTATAKVSSKGQIVLPAQLRRRIGLAAGDAVVIDFDEASQEIRLRRRENWDEMSARFKSWIKPGTPPLLDVHELYETREPRL